MALMAWPLVEQPFCGLEKGPVKSEGKPYICINIFIP